MRSVFSRSSRLAAAVAYAALLTLPRWSSGKEKRLANILDPNREVPPNYFDYSRVTVRQPLGVEVVVARAQIATMQASKPSLMPEGLEEGLTEQDLAEFLDFIFADVH